MKERKNERMEEVCVSAHAHGKLNNVFLSSSEYEKFRSDYPDICDKVIDELSCKIETDKNKYKSGHLGHLYIFARNYTPKKESVQESSASYDIQLAMKRSLNIDPNKTKRNIDRTQHAVP